MQPLIPYLLGQAHPSGKRIVDSQKSIRTQDIEEVGDNRHTTFFEMLGNWSLGDYFKNEQLPWIFEFLTDELNLDPSRLYVSVFEGNDSVPKDTESIEIWKKIFASVGIDAKVGERIFTYPAKKIGGVDLVSQTKCQLGNREDLIVKYFLILENS